MRSGSARLYMAHFPATSDLGANVSRHNRPYCCGVVYLTRLLR
jgi:hypothetical protein